MSDPNEIAITTEGRAAFDYETLHADAAARLRSAALRIRERMQGSIFETGRDLIAIKDLLEHGAWGAWLKAEFGMTARSAQRYMNAAGLASKSDTVSVLPPTAIYKLASPSTPDIARDTIIDRLEKGEMVSMKEVTDEIDCRRREQAEADRLAKLSPKERERKKRQREKRQRESAASEAKWRKCEEEKRSAAQQAIAIARDRLDAESFKEFAILIQRSSGWRFADELHKALEGNP